jgi:tetratricopeptide (TPR) repeat protein
MKNLLVLLVLLTSELFAGENKGCVEFFGTVSSDQFSVSDVSIELIKNGSPESSFYNNNGGDFGIRFEKDNLYEVKISKKGYFSQKFEVDTKGVEGDDGMFTCKFAIDLVPFVDGVDAQIFNQPVAVIKYNPRTDDFERIIDKQMMVKIRQFFDSYESRKEVIYKTLVASADNAASNKDYKLAKELYSNAVKLESNDDYADIQLEMIDKIIAQELRIQILYEKNIADADVYLTQKDYKKAKKLYEKALLLKDETYPKEQIAALNKTILQEEELAADY